MTEKGAYTPARLVLLAELLALAIGIVTPIMPSKTGATRGIPHLFLAEPSHWQEVLVYFLVANLMMAVLAIIVIASVRGERDA